MELKVPVHQIESNSIFPELPISTDYIISVHNTNHWLMFLISSSLVLWHLCYVFCDRHFLACTIFFLFRRTILSLLCLSFFMYGYGYLSRGFMDRHEVLHDGSATSQTGLLLFLNGRIFGVHWGHMAGYASCWSTCFPVVCEIVHFLNLCDSICWTRICSDVRRRCCVATANARICRQRRSHCLQWRHRWPGDDLQW